MAYIPLNDNSLNLTSLSANTIYSGITDLMTYINNSLAVYRPISQGGANIQSGQTAGIYLVSGQFNASLPKSLSLSSLAPSIINIKSADYPSVNGLTPKLRIRATLFCNGIAPTGNFTFGLYPISYSGTGSQGGNGVIYSAGTVVSTSTGATINTPAASSINNLVSSDFALPADGLYSIGCLTTSTIATGSMAHIVTHLQMHYT